MCRRSAAVLLGLVAACAHAQPLPGRPDATGAPWQPAQARPPIQPGAPAGTWAAPARAAAGTLAPAPPGAPPRLNRGQIQQMLGLTGSAAPPGGASPPGGARPPGGAFAGGNPPPAGPAASTINMMPAGVAPAAGNTLPLDIPPPAGNTLPLGAAPAVGNTPALGASLPAGNVLPIVTEPSGMAAGAPTAAPALRAETYPGATPLPAPTRPSAFEADYLRQRARIAADPRCQQFTIDADDIAFGRLQESQKRAALAGVVQQAAAGGCVAGR